MLEVLMTSFMLLCVSCITRVDNGADWSVNKLVFLTTRVDNKDAATLVSSGPHGHIHFWNVFSSGCLMAHFLAVSASLHVWSLHFLLWRVDNWVIPRADRSVPSINAVCGDAMLGQVRPYTRALEICYFQTKIIITLYGKGSSLLWTLPLLAYSPHILSETTPVAPSSMHCVLSRDAS